MISGKHLNVAGSVRRGVVGRLQHHRGLVGGVDEGVVGIGVPAVQIVVDLGFNSLAAGFGGVLEVAEHGYQCACHVDDVVARSNPEYPETPAEPPGFGVGAQISAQASLVSARNDLLERRVGNQKIVDHAWVNRVRASELERGRRAVRLRNTGIGREIRQDFVGRTHHGVDPRKAAAAGQQRVGAGFVEQIDLRAIVAGAGRDRQFGRHVDRVGDVDSRIGVLGLQADWRQSPPMVPSSLPAVN